MSGGFKKFWILVLIWYGLSIGASFIYWSTLDRGMRLGATYNLLYDTPVGLIFFPHFFTVKFLAAFFPYWNMNLLGYLIILLAYLFTALVIYLVFKALRNILIRRSKKMS